MKQLTSSNERNGPYFLCFCHKKKHIRIRDLNISELSGAMRTKGVLSYFTLSNTPPPPPQLAGMLDKFRVLFVVFHNNKKIAYP